MQHKKVLVMCTGNSCRSIIAEALINAHIDGVEAYSCGVAPSGTVNKNAQKILQQNGIWRESYHSKNLETLADIDFDLVVTVCDHAKETCPLFESSTTTLHVGFEDPDGKDFAAFEQTYQEIYTTLLPQVEQFFKQKSKGETMQKKVSQTDSGVKINFLGAVEKQNIVTMVQNCSTGQCECMSDATKEKIQNMSISGDDGNVELNIEGDISKEEIQAALQKSKVLN